MSKETREHISCLVDGEISRETSRFLVRRLGADEDLRATWTRYHLVRDCLRHQDGGMAREDLCARVSRALENDEAPEHHARQFSRAWLKPVAGLAVAASVALMAIVAVDSGGPGPRQPTVGLAGNSPAEQFTSPQSLTPAPYSSQASLNGESNRKDRKMNSYVLRHYQATGASSGKGFVTFIPIVVTGSGTSNESTGREEETDQAGERDEAELR